MILSGRSYRVALARAVSPRLRASRLELREKQALAAAKSPIAAARRHAMFAAMSI
jgi:hypothetical protein